MQTCAGRIIGPVGASVQITDFLINLDRRKYSAERSPPKIRKDIKMKKDLGLLQAVYPMPVLMIGTYDEYGKPNVMNVAWGQIADMDKVILFIGEGKKTWLNIEKSKAFTVALADEAHMDVADFFGIASGNKIDDKFRRTGYHEAPSDKVNAPIIEEFPLVMECELIEFLKTESLSAVIGKIVNVKAEESVLDENGKVDPKRLHALMFDSFQSGYYTTGEKIGQAWNEGIPLYKQGQ